MRQTCAQQYTVKITLGNPSKRNGANNAGPYDTIQDFSDYKWQKPKSYYSLQQKILFFRKLWEGLKDSKAKTAPPTWRMETKNLTTGFLFKSLSLIFTFSIFTSSLPQYRAALSKMVAINKKWPMSIWNMTSPNWEMLKNKMYTDLKDFVHYIYI